MRLFWPSHILRAASEKSVDWSHTLHLPKSSFPARPPPAKLEEYRSRCADDLYTWQRANRSRTTSDNVDNDFILHDGPPYANGPVHVGHALNKISKDLILRSELGRGKRVKYQPGWDCHGLPIELKALQQQKLSALQSGNRPEGWSNAEHLDAVHGADRKGGEIRESARQLASTTIEKQKKAFMSWAIMGEWEKPYTTMQKDFELRQLEVFRQMVQNGLIFRAARPVYWSPSSRTALAESELEYDDQHKCKAAFVKMRLQDSDALRSLFGSADEAVYAVIWTTTPWTLPANKAIAVNASIRYSTVRMVNPDGEIEPGLLIIASPRLDHVASYLPEGWSLQSTNTYISGEDLAKLPSGYHEPFSGSISRIVTAAFVSDSSGTGLVHMAPGHGMEDYQVCQAEGIGPAFAPVDDAGRYTADVAPELEDQTQLTGLKVGFEGQKTVLAILRRPARYFRSSPEQQSLIVATHTLTHKNPIDWRTKTPVIVRSTAQWFADVSKINQRALAALEHVQFIPAAGENRLKAFIQGRSQWCISRQRAWGVPIPVLYHSMTGEENKSDEVIRHIISTISTRGTDKWFTDAPDDPVWIAPGLDAKEWVRRYDTMDVWFDSGTSWTSMEERDGRKQADVYLEGSDQHRGWFQSSLLTRIATDSADSPPTAPYKTLITHGFTLDGDGRKMSKSIGNVVSPEEIISGAFMRAQPGGKKTKGKQDPLGPDLLRLWAASCDYTKDVSVSGPALQIIQQALQKYRITMRFMLGVMQDAEIGELPQELPICDRIILGRLMNRSKAIFEAYKEYKFYDGVRELNAFVSTDLSAFYFEIIKDTMYAGIQADRQRTQAVLTVILKELLHWLAPLTPHLVEETWEHIPERLRGTAITYPLHAIWHGPPSPLSDHDVRQCEAATAFFEPVSRAVKTAQEKARTAGKLGSGLACAVKMALPLQALQDSGFDQQQLRDALVISELRVVDASDDTVSSAETEGTPPAWSYSEKIEDGMVVGLHGVVKVMPPRADKCPRCWQYNSSTAETLCNRCQSAVSELPSST